MKFKCNVMKFIFKKKLGERRWKTLLQLFENKRFWDDERETVQERRVHGF